MVWLQGAPLVALVSGIERLATLANLRSFPPYVDLYSILFLNLVVIVPIEAIGLLIVGWRILGSKLKLVQSLALALVANLVTALLGFPLVQMVGLSYTLGWTVALYILSSLIEGATYQLLLRKRGIRFERVFLLAFATNLFTYIPMVILESI